MASEELKSGAWSDDEHRRFLLGLQIYGKGDWKNISRFVVKSRSNSQVASHAKTYFAAQEREQEQEKKYARGPWKEDEHRLFVEGVEEFGKGKWKSISDFVVRSRNPKQIASHARSYYARQQKLEQNKKRRSINDITNAQSRSH